MALLPYLLIALILIGVPVVAYCLATLNAPETPAQRRKRDAAHRARLNAQRDVRRAARRVRRDTRFA